MGRGGGTKQRWKREKTIHSVLLANVQHKKYILGGTALFTPLYSGVNNDGSSLFQNIESMVASHCSDVCKPEPNLETRGHSGDVGRIWKSTKVTRLTRHLDGIEFQAGPAVHWD